MVITIRFRLAAAIAAVILCAAPARAGEEIMAMAPGADVQQWLDKNKDDAVAAARQNLQQNIIKLTLPSPAERKTSISPGSGLGGDSDITEAARTFIPPPPRATRTPKSEPEPEKPIIRPKGTMPSLRPPSAVDAPENLPKSTSAKITIRSAPTPAPKHDAGNNEAIPGLVTPQQLATQKLATQSQPQPSIPARASGVDIDTRDRDIMKELVSFGGLMAMAAAAPPLPEIGDPYVDTLEPFRAPPDPAPARPDPLSVPGPISGNRNSEAVSFHSRAPKPTYDLLPIPAVSAVASARPAPAYSVPALPPFQSAAPVISSQRPIASQRFSGSPVLTGPSAPTPLANNNSGNSGSGPLFLPIPPMGGTGDSIGAPLAGSVAAGGTLPAPSHRAVSVQSADLASDLASDLAVFEPVGIRSGPAHPGSGPGPGMTISPDIKLPAALTPSEFAALEEVGFPQPPRPTARRRPAPEEEVAPAPAKPKEKAPPKRRWFGGRAKQEPEPPPPPPQRKRAKVEGFTNMRDELIGPPDPRMFSTR